DAASSQVVVINQKLADWLFGHLDPIGRVVRIAGLPYTVIGVFNPPPSLFGEENNFQAFLPHGAFVKYVPYWKGWMSFLVGPTDSATTLQAMEDVTVALRVARGLRPGQENNFAVVSQEKFLESVNSTTLVLRVVMIVLSLVGLAVGGGGGGHRNPVRHLPRQPRRTARPGGGAAVRIRPSATPCPSSKPSASPSRPSGRRS